MWAYVVQEAIPLVPLYFAAERPVVDRDGTLVMVDDHRMRLRPNEVPQMRRVRFRSLGCHPLSGAVPSDAATPQAVLAERPATRTSGRGGRLIDRDEGDSMEREKREGYF